MIVLGIETATEQVGCALGGVEGLLGSFHAARGRRHAETLTPAISFVCKQSEIDLGEVRVIAVDIGPGLFTGLRVGIATAKSLAQALGIGLIGISSLDLLAHQVRHSRRLIVPVIDAKRGEVFSARYRHVDRGVQRLSEPAVGTAADLASELAAGREEILLVGDGAIRYADVFAAAADDLVEPATPSNAYPSAADLVELAHPRALREEWVPPGEIKAVYLRKADAEINWERRAGVGGE